MIEKKSLNVLVLGAGGREHALCKKIAESPLLNQLSVLPGNAGMEADGFECMLGGAHDFMSIKESALIGNAHLVVVGPEAPLVAGIVDRMHEDSLLNHIKVFGPTAAGARLEGSKEFAKDFMERHGIPTAYHKSFGREEEQEAIAHLELVADPPYVLKADGLAGGKGVLICSTLDEAKEALHELLAGQFGKASERVVIEKFLYGTECSVFVMTDGKSYQILPVAKDYKRVGDGDKGPNTGGMGSVSPVPFVNQELMAKIEDRIIKPTIEGLKKDKIAYTGFIFLGLMCTQSGDPYLIEYNVRMGDPETQVVMPRIEGDILAAMMAACHGKLSSVSLSEKPEACVSITLAEEGYPGAYEVGKIIEFTKDLPKGGWLIHAGTHMVEDEVVSTGGRVMSACGMAKEIPDAIACAYQTADTVKFDGMFTRSDIGQDLL